MKAFLIMNMQPSVLATPHFRLDAVIETIHDLADKARHAGCPLVFVCHQAQRGPSEQPDPCIPRQSGDILIAKQWDDAFVGTGLKEVLAQYYVTELVMMGAATEGCFDATLKSAISRGFKVTVVADGHTLADTPDAQQRIDQYHWNWLNLIQPRNAVSIIEAASVSENSG